mmetsp:Transcript_103443/g.166763  ORF Transcript_103443/g.166763 Transcript_103443/m.166763 type:complete len:260 (+) Transcript_103443:541-1320(+)
MVGSPVITVRAEKSTRFPMRLPRTRPSLPLMRWRRDLIDLPLRCCAWGCPASSLLYIVAMWYCSICCCSSNTDGASPCDCWLRSVLLTLRTSDSLNVMSSSPLEPPSVIMAGRTCGGDTGSTVSTIQSGRQKRGSNPSFSQSSSVILLRISSASSAYSSRSPVVVSSTCASFGGAGGYFTRKLRPERNTPGCDAPQPRSTVSSPLSVGSCLHVFWPLQMLARAARRACGCLLRSAARKLISFSSFMSLPHLWQQHDNSF